jgi:acyl carrier protein
MQDLVGAILGIMGLNEANIGENDDLSQMGIDSMQVVEVRSTLQRALGRPFPLDEVHRRQLFRRSW